MLSNKSLTVGLTVLVVIFLNIGQGVALKCYVCDSISEKNCTSNFKNEKYEKSCKDIKEPWVTFKNNLPGAAAKPEGELAYECVEIKNLKGAAKNSSAVHVLRTCMPVGLTEKYLKANFEQYKVTVDNAFICGSDLCNSSSSVYAGISSVLFSTIMLFFMK